MELTLTFGHALCYTPSFIINDVEAEWEDFGEKYDRDAENAEPYACSDMRFTRIPPTPKVLAKYSITETEYDTIADKLEDGLSFGSCGWCV